MPTDLAAPDCTLDPACCLSDGHAGACEMEPVPTPMLPAVNVESLLAQAVSGSVSVETLERLLALREKLRDEQARAAFFAALAAFQAECPIIPKTKTVRGSYSYSYAPLEVIIAHVRPIMQRHGLSVTFDTTDEEAAKVVHCTVHHVAGHSETNRFRVPIDAGARMNDIQKDASAATYGKRYAFCNALGIMTGDEDDDGNLGGTKPGELQKAGPAQPFTPPRRASERTPYEPPGYQHPDVDQAPGPERPAGGRDGEAVDWKPPDALTEGKVRVVYAKTHAALKAIGRDDAASMTLVLAELDRRAKEEGRDSWKLISWRRFNDLCDSIAEIVDGLPKAHARRVRPHA